MTVLFCDLVGSTALSEALDPETLRSVTLRYFAAMQAEIERFGGTVEKFIGDAVMAVFGVPVMHEDDAHRAVAAALGMLEALAVLNAQLEPSLGVRLQVRIGVNTGPAVTGSDIAARQALVSGETVNVAARLEQNAGQGEILIGPVTRAALGPAARAEAVGPLRLKGKQDPVTAHRLLGLGEDAPELTRRFDLPFVGREALFEELDAVLESTRGGARMVTVQGEPGIGKTRLVRTWLDRASRPIALGVGRCRPYGERGSLAPLADAVRQLLDEEAGEQAARRNGEAMAVLAGGLLRDGTPGSSTDATCSALLRVLESVTKDGVGQDRASAESTAKERTVVLALDDCQWASDPLLDALDRLVDAASGSVMVLRLARLEFADRLAGPAGHTDQADVLRRTLTVPALSPGECETLADALVEVGAHRSAGRGRLIEQSGGNPFHLEQLIAAIHETDQDDEIPHSLQALLGARLDALDPGERTTLDLAAVLGREFAPPHVAALAEAESEDVALHGAFAGLSRRHLIEAAGSPHRGAGRVSPAHVALRFSSGLVHEATYQAMAKRTRADRHERAAGILLDRQAADSTVAGHLERAYSYRAELGVRDDALETLRRRAAALLACAGERALARSDLAWAGTLLERAVGLFAAGEPGWARATRQLGEVRVAAGRAEEGRVLLRQVLERARPEAALPDGSAESVEAAHTALALAVSEPDHVVQAAARAARRALPVFVAAGDDLGLARATVRMAQEQQLLGRHARAARLLDRSLAHAARCDVEPEPELALALGAVGVSLWRGPTPVAVAAGRCRELLAGYGGPRPGVRVTLACPLAVLLALGDDQVGGRALLAEAERTAGELGYAEGRIVLPVFAATVESLAGEPAAALALLGRAESAARELGADGMLGMVALEQARVLLEMGRGAEAAARADAAAAPGRLLLSDAADLAGMRARLAAAEGRPREAADLAGEAVEAASRTDSPLVQAVAALDRAEVLARLGQHGQAAESARAALRRFGDKGHLPGARKAARLLTRLGAARGPDPGETALHPKGLPAAPDLRPAARPNHSRATEYKDPAGAAPDSSLRRFADFDPDLAQPPEEDSP